MFVVRRSIIPQTLQRILELVLQPAGSRESLRARLLRAVRIASSVPEKREDMGRKMVVQALVRILSELARRPTTVGNPHGPTTHACDFLSLR